MLPRALLVLLVLALLAPAGASATAVTFGSDLSAEPNVQYGCEVKPALGDDGGTGTFYPTPSNTADCTWRQAGVYNSPNDRRHSSVPGDGTITHIDVKSGPNPAPLRFAIIRQYAAPGVTSQCCFFEYETATVNLRPSDTTPIDVNMPVQRNTINGAEAFDLLAISAASNTGTLPLHSNGQNNYFQTTQQGSVNAGFFYPRMGSQPNDSGGGRREEGIPGIEVLIRWTWCAAGDQTCQPGSGGNPGGGNPGGGNPGGGNPGGGNPEGGNTNASTAGADNLTGTGGPDRICGLGGADTINGLQGNDTLFGDQCPVAAKVFGAAAGDGDDKLTGSSGNDKLYGGGGNDVLDGGAGNDTLVGGSGKNSYSGGAGKDKVSARNGRKETVNCGKGKDSATIDKRDKVRGCEKVKRARK